MQNTLRLILKIITDKVLEKAQLQPIDFEEVLHDCKKDSELKANSVSCSAVFVDHIT